MDLKYSGCPKCSLHPRHHGEQTRSVVPIVVPSITIVTFACCQEIRMHLKKEKHVSKENSQSRRDRRSPKRKTIEFRNLPPMADMKTIHDTPEARLGSLPRYAIIQKDLTPRQVFGRL